MSNDKLYDSGTEQTPPHHRPEHTDRYSATRDGFLTTSWNVVAAGVTLKESQRRSGKRPAGSCPTALGGQIPQHPVFVPARQKPTPSPSRQ